MVKLIIITGPQGCGKSTFARENYPYAYILDYDGNLKEIKIAIKHNDLTVVCCLPMDSIDLIPSDKNKNYQIITLNSKGEVAQICGRGFTAHKMPYIIESYKVEPKGNLDKLFEKKVAEGVSNFWKKNIEDFAKQFTNEQQLSFHRSEVERIEKLIKEENKPKVGDWLSIKVTEQNRNKLIKLLEDECRKNL